MNQHSCLPLRFGILITGSLLLGLNWGLFPASDAQQIQLQRLKTASGATVVQAIRVQDGELATPKLDVAGEGPAQDGVAVAADGTSATAATEFNEDSVRLEKLLALTFDRSRSAILAAWAAEKLPERVDPPDEEAETAEIETKPEEPKEGEAATPAPLAAMVAEKTKAIEEELKTLGRAVTLGRWSEVGEYIGKLPEKNRNKVYLHLLTGLAGDPPGNRPEAPAVALAQQAISPIDLIELADAAPAALGQKQLALLSKILSKTLASGYVTSEIMEQVRSGTQRLGGTDRKLRSAAAQLFLDAGAPESAVEFLPEWPAQTDSIPTADLQLLAKYFDGRYKKESKPDWLKKSWDVHLALLPRDDMKIAERNAVLRRTVEISTLIDKSLGAEWLDESFTKDVNRGIEILSSIGGAAATELATSYAKPAQRHALLKLQNKAAESLLRVSPEQAGQWRTTLTLLAEQWIREGEITRQFGGIAYGGQNMNFDRYGNFYYAEEEQNENSQYRGSVIDSRDLLEIKPSQEWSKVVDPALQPRLATQAAQLHLKIGEEDKAFPLIEKLAPAQPEIARELVHDFLKTWTKNHDPNQERRMYNPYSYIFGYNANAEAIPLSRSRQQRNLEELRTWVARIRKLPIEPIDESLLATAFTTCHSSAEVFQMDAFTAVFGDLQSLKPETIAAISQTMRGNLASVWRQMRNQEANKTKRKEHEVIQEVVRGYQVALEVVGEAREKYQDDWQLMLEEATLLFDFNSYIQVVSPTSKYIEMRDAAFQQFQHAAELYAEKVSSLSLNEQKTDVFDYWFYAALGSTDLGQLSHLNAPDTKQFALISAAIDTLPGETADNHLAKFANKLFTRLSSVPPQAKYRFLKGGFEIVEDHPLAWEAKRTFDYYNDTVNEIKLVTELDGANQVGHQRPFGVFVKLLHTNEMERESGGFQKYAQNQTQATFYYNYGRPNEDYRDKFEEGVRTALSENFEILSVTFENPKNMRSRPDRKDGWRQTPYAYLMLQTKGPQVDRLPPLQLNLDFMDAAGFVVLPVESPALVIDAGSEGVPSRPYSRLSVIQTLDERQVEEGKLLLEVRATAQGLVPELDEILDLDFGDLVQTRIEDQRTSPSGFVEQLDEIAIQSDRSWLIELEAAEGKSITQFAFLDTKDDETKLICQQYQDADLVAANPVVMIATKLEQFDWRKNLTIAGLGAVAALGLGVFSVYWLRRPRPAKVKAFEMPPEINPFTVLGLLQKIQSQAQLKDAQRGELSDSIRNVQQSYFAPQNGHPSVQLEEIARNWLRRVS